MLARFARTVAAAKTVFAGEFTMSDIALIYLIEQEPDVQQRFGEAARRLGCRLHLGGDMTGAAADICALRPDVVILPARYEGDL